MTKQKKKYLLSAMTAILLIVFGFKLMNLSDEPVVEPKVNEKAEEQSKAKQPIIDETEKDLDQFELTSSEVAEPEEIEEEIEEVVEEPPVQNEPDPEPVEVETVEAVETETQQESNEKPVEQPKIEKPKIEVVPSSSLAMTNYLLPDVNSEPRVESATHVMLHFTSNAYANPKDPYKIEDTYNIFKDYEVSAHYVIGRAGEIYLFVPENRVAYHAGRGQLSGYPEYDDRLNHYSIGIELLGMGTRDEMVPLITKEKFDQVDQTMTGFTEAQYSTLNTLLTDIVGRHPHIQKNRNHIVGHDEYQPGKTDPGSLFDWSKIGL